METIDKTGQFNPHPIHQWTWNIPEHFNIGVACTDWPAENGFAETEAIIIDDAERGVETLSFRQLAEKSSEFAQRLQEHGIVPGDRVIIHLANGLDFPIAFFGILKLGAIAVPTSIMLTEEELDYIRRDSGAKVIITDEWMKNYYINPPGPLFQRGNDYAVGKEDLNLLPPLVKGARGICSTLAGDPAYLVYTSGTTGYPKGVLHAHRALLGRQPASTYWLDFQAGDRVLHTGKLNWTYTLGTGLMDPLYRGLTVILREGVNDPVAWPDLIAKHRATHFISVPTIYRQILQKTSASARDIPSLRHCASAGEALSADVAEEWQTRFGMPIYEGFGMTECSYYLSQQKNHPIKCGTAGLPQPGHDIRLLDEALQEVTIGEEGMIAIPANDPALCLNYWNDHSLNHCDYFLTGDYARRDENGYVYFTGRKDDIINTFGYRVSPHEIERVMRAHLSVSDCAAVSEEVEKEKIVVALYVIVKERHITEEMLIDYAHAHLAGYKCPKKVYFVEDFPRTKTGKVIRKELKRSIL